MPDEPAKELPVTFPNALRLLTGKTPTVEEYHLAPEKLLVGNPLQQVWLDHTDATGQFFAGTWRSEPGKWHIRYTEEEYCELLEGHSVVTDNTGQATALHAGDRFVIPRGFAGTWEVLVTTTKRFVIFEAKT
jgi:uncharacterized cupin superfamily protein